MSVSGETTSEARLAERYELDSLQISISGHAYDLIHPKSVDDLISEEDFDKDERLPYWANIWPSARVLAMLVGEQQGRCRRLLELGCGSGLVALVAARAGFEVLATDYYHEALEFVDVNARRNGLPVETRMVDWRSFPPELANFDYVVAADVLYEKPMAGLIADVLLKTLSPAGRGLVADPRRLVAKPFRDVCQQKGLSAKLFRETVIPQPTSDVTVEIFEVLRK